jgi:hypothetical protein
MPIFSDMMLSDWALIFAIFMACIIGICGILATKD